MNKILITLFIFLIILAVSACGADNKNSENVDAGNVQEIEKTPAVEESEQTKKPQVSQNSKESAEATDSEEEQEDEADRLKILEYLQILGLDEDTQYTLLDKFPIEGSEEVSILTDIIDIDSEAFDVIIDSMKANGCYLVSDIMRNEEKQTTSMQFRNADDSLYIELVYSADADYITIIFSPFN